MDVIVTHVNADFDALGGLVGAARLYPNAAMVLPGGEAPAVGDFLSLHREFIATRRPPDVDPETITRVIVVDTNSRSRLGPAAEWLDLPEVEVHLYDHHPGENDLNAGTARVERWGSVSSILAHELRERGDLPTAVEATTLLLGIYEDTGSLLYAGTRPEDLEAAAWLLRCGGDLEVVESFTHRTLTPAQRHLLARLLDDMSRHSLRGSTVALAAAAAEEYVDEAAVLIHRILDLEEMSAAFILVEMEGALYVIGRSRSDTVDVRGALEQFGGGGHPRAASATVRDRPVEQVRASLLGWLEKNVRPEPTARQLMSYPVRTVGPESTVGEAWRRMVRYGHSGLVVMDQARPVGVLTRRDVDKARHHRLDHAPVRGFMSSEVVTVAPDTSLSDLERLMIQESIGRLPVVEDELVVGIVTRGDVLKALHGERYLEGARKTLEEPVARLLSERLPAGIQRLIHDIGETAAREGALAYLVGGLVRDLLQDVPNLDLDVLVEPDAVALARAVAGDLEGEFRAHERFGTATVMLRDGFKVDFTTARTEAYTHPGALPDVEASSVVDDLRRRDFTLNAMAISIVPETFGELLDPFGGRRDLERRRLRVLHPLSFIEDPTRIFRGVRFAERFQLGFEKRTEQLAREAVEADALARISADRLRRELRFVVREPKPLGALLRLEALGVLQWLVPGLALEQRLLAAVPGALDWWRKSGGGEVDPLRLYLAALLAPLGPEAAARTAEERLGVPPMDAEVIRAGVEAAQRPEALLPEGAKASEITRMLKGQPPEVLLLLRAACRAPGSDQKERAAALDRFVREWRHTKLEITGEDLKGLGIRPGPEMGRALQRTLDARLDGEVSGRDAELEYAASVLRAPERERDEA